MKERIRGLDGLKGIVAIFIAYVYHYFILFEVDPFQSNIILDKLFYYINVYTGYSEAVFFLLSGFLLAYVYEEKIPNLSLKEFFWPRIKMLYPLMIFSVIAVFLLENLGLHLFGAYPLHGENGEVQYGLLSLVVSCLGVQTGYFSDGDLHSVNGPAWYISVLFLCYLISVLIVKVVRDEKKRECCFGAFFLLGVIISVKGGFDFPLLYACCGRGFTGFFLGYLMEKRVNRRKLLPTWAVMVLICEMVVVLYLTETSLVAYRRILTELLVYPVTLYIVLKSKRVSEVLQKKIPRFFGRISLYMYLLNFPIFVGIAFVNRALSLNLGYGNPLVWLAITAGSIGLSYLMSKVSVVLWKSER